MLERFREDALRERDSEGRTAISKDVGRTTTSLGIVGAECDWYRDEYGVFWLWEDAYGGTV